LVFQKQNRRNNLDLMRLNRFLAAAGFGSRRSCEQLISGGHVVINGHKTTVLATQIEEGDDVRVDGRPARAAVQLTILFNKPRGYVVTRSDERGRRTIYDLLPASHSSLFHVGRLDKESEGLLLMTNDGILAQELTHPSHGIEKEYEVELDKAFDFSHVEKLLKGIHIEGGRGKFERVRTIAPKKLCVVLRQGIKRQIRLMFYTLGYEVERLRRIRIGKLLDNRLPQGAWRPLSVKERGLLRDAPKKAVAPQKSHPLRQAS
jgi:23S rRNA pseudouridine2605 synthase